MQHLPAGTTRDRRAHSPRPRARASFVSTSFVLALLLFVSPAATAGAATSAQWSWPLDGTPSVVRGFDLPTEPWLAGHRGVDLRSSPGAPVRAAGSGQVTFAGWVGGLPAVSVTHPGGLRTTYQPVLAAVARGATVTRGALLGRVSAGGSHCLPEACLHWGLRATDGSYLDPLSLLGTEQQVRLLPAWSDPASLPAVPASTARPSWSPARLGALNRARASPCGPFG
jgi:murein DD-endopeptidase MepM/ murein hydrolase activator NlpD